MTGAVKFWTACGLSLLIWLGIHYFDCQKIFCTRCDIFVFSCIVILFLDIMWVVLLGLSEYKGIWYWTLYLPIKYFNIFLNKIL